MPAQPPLPPKKDVALALLEGPSVYVHLDPRRDGVVVPKRFTTQPQLVLQIGLNMAVPIRDLDVTNDGITCTLSFDRRPFWCSMPWSAVFALVGEDGRGMVWPEDVPPELAATTQRPSLRAVPSTRASGEPRKRRRRKRDASPEGVMSLEALHEEAMADEAEEEELGARADAHPIGDAASEGTLDRPVLRAVPMPDEEPASQPAVPLEEGPAEDGNAALQARPSDPGEAPEGEQAANQEGKRKLPPYLRVIK